jgi:hypothetical protein
MGVGNPAGFSAQSPQAGGCRRGVAEVFSTHGGLLCTAGLCEGEHGSPRCPQYEYGDDEIKQLKHYYPRGGTYMWRNR